MKKMGNKEAISLAMAFFKGNVALSLGALAILIVVELFNLIPIVGIFFAILYPILIFSIQIYVGRLANEKASEDYMIKASSSSNLKELFLKYIDIATGGFLGSLIVTFVIFFLMGIALSFSFDTSTLQSSDMQTLYNSVNGGIAIENSNLQNLYASINPNIAMVVLVIFLTILTWFGYLMPGVFGEIILAENFQDAFKKSLYFFYPKFWAKTLNRDYFILVFIWSIIVFLAIIAISLLFMTLFLIPIAFITLYYIALYNAIVYIFAIKSFKEKKENVI